MWGQIRIILKSAPAAPASWRDRAAIEASMLPERWKIWCFGLAALTFAVDQLHKWWMLQVYGIADLAPVTVTSFLDLVLVWNPGVSYGLFPQNSETGRIILILLHYYCHYLDPGLDAAILVTDCLVCACAGRWWGSGKPCRPAQFWCGCRFFRVPRLRVSLVRF